MKAGGQVYTPYSCLAFEIRADGTAATDIEQHRGAPPRRSPEAHDSRIADDRRRDIAADLDNLTIADSRVNRTEKSDRDAGQWTPAPVTGPVLHRDRLLGTGDRLRAVVGNGSASELQGNNATYTVTITPAASGTVTVDIAAGAAQDSAPAGGKRGQQVRRWLEPPVAGAPSPLRRGGVTGQLSQCHDLSPRRRMPAGRQDRGHTSHLKRMQSRSRRCFDRREGGFPGPGCGPDETRVGRWRSRTVRSRLASSCRLASASHNEQAALARESERGLQPIGRGPRARADGRARRQRPSTLLEDDAQAQQHAATRAGIREAAAN